MNLDRLRWGEWIAAIAALDLLVVTFRAWYKVTGSGVHVTAWDALDKGRYLLIATAVVGIFLWLIKAAEDTRRLSFEPGWIAAVVGFICTVYIAYRLASPPSDALEAAIGIYLGLASAVGITIGGLLSAREPAAAAEAPGGFAAAGAGAGGATGPRTAEASPTWSPAAPAASTTGWSPATPAVAVPPATAAGAALGGGAGSEHPLRSGDHVVLTAGGARFPAGTVAQVIEVFGGGALVEVKAADGMAERFEVPAQAYERAPAGGAGQLASGEGWSPAMPAAAGGDWGFDDPANGAAAADAPAKANGAAVDESQAEKVPWWKREIGGGKKKKGEEALALGGAAAAGAAAAKLADRNGSSEEKPGFFKRVFGGGAKPEPETEVLDAQAPGDAPAEAAPAADAAGPGAAPESDAAAAEPPAESAVDEAPSTTADEAAGAEAESDTKAESAGAAGASAAAGGAAATAAGSGDAAPAAPRAASEDAAGAGATSSEPETTAAPEPSAGSPSEAADASPSATEPEPTPSDPAPAPSAGGPGIGGAGVAAAGAGAAAAAAASAGGAGPDEEAEQPKRKRSSGSKNIPKEALSTAAVDEQPKVGDEVQLKVGGGKFDAGARGTVVDVFSAGVIVELNSGDGRTERVDLPFEAIGPAGA